MAPERSDLADKYFERLDGAQQPGVKRPDLIVVRNRDWPRVDAFLQSIGGALELQFKPENELRPLLDLAVLGVECENSLWKAERMPDYGKPLRVQRRTLKLGMPKTAVLPTVILKKEDLEPLCAWQQSQGIEVHIWQIFFDRAWGIALNRACQLIQDGFISPTVQTFHAPSGATTQKIIYKIWYQHAYSVGASASVPALIAEYVEEKNGKILPFARFEGGSLHLSEESLAALDNAARVRR